MTALLKKLQWDGLGPVLLRSAPDDVAQRLADAGAPVVASPVSASLAVLFAMTKAEVVELAAAICPQWIADKPLWLAYPKQSSKRYRADFNRDTGFAALGEFGFEAVRQIAIDDDWSALRFRRVEFIRSLKRDPRRALSAEGKRRVG